MARQEFDDSNRVKVDLQDHGHQGDAASANLNSAELFKDQAVHIQAYKKVGEDTYKQVLDCSGEIYTSDGRAGAAGHCVPENNGADLYKITDGKGVSHYASETTVDRKHDLAVFKSIDVTPMEYKDIYLGKNDSGSANSKHDSSDGAKSDDQPSSNTVGDQLTATVYSNGSHDATQLNATLDENVELGQFVPAGKELPGQDLTMAVQKLYGNVENGNSGAMVVDQTTNKPIGVLDYSSKSKGEAVAIPIKLMKDLLDNSANQIKQNQVEPSRKANEG